MKPIIVMTEDQLAEFTSRFEDTRSARRYVQEMGLPDQTYTILRIQQHGLKVDEVPVRRRLVGGESTIKRARREA